LQQAIDTADVDVCNDEVDNDQDSSTSDICILPFLYDSIDYVNNDIIDAADIDVFDAVVAGSQDCPSGKICDINADRSIDSIDRAFIQNIVAFSGTPEICYDMVDNDEDPTTSDICPSDIYAAVDLNDDGVLNSDDRGMLYNIMDGIQSCSSSHICDINADSFVDLLDWQFVEEFVTNQTAFEICYDTYDTDGDGFIDASC
jgi:hypothetical protein